MIEKMKAVCIVSALSSRKALLSGMRDLGVVHIRQKKHADPQVTAEFARISANYNALCDIEGASAEKPALKQKEFESLDCRVTEALSSRKENSDAAVRLSMQADRIRAWGAFVPSEVTELSENGVPLYFYRMGKKELASLASDEKVRFIRLSPVEKMDTVAVLDEKLPSSFPATEFDLPEKGLEELDKELAKCNEQIQKAEEELKKASLELATYKAQMVRCRNDIEFSCAEKTSQEDTDLVWISGYIPEDACAEFEKTAKANCWAYAMDDVAADDEFVPTKVKYTKVSGLMEPVFDILGTVPAYHEYDISFWFLCFFSLFFAMIIGDAGYGFCFLSVAVLLHVKQKKVTNLTWLVYVVSIATIVWGALTGTWFGLEGAMKVGVLRALVIPSFANYPQYFGYTSIQQQNVMMKFCFILGTIQLSLACIMNVRRKLAVRDGSFLADIGWFMSINSLYYVVLLLVINQDVDLTLCLAFILSGFLLVCMYGGMSPDKSFKEGLKAGLADIFTDFLNTISAFGNIMSYIRLFAVGLASLAIAQSFNDMALGMNGWLKIAGILVFVIGHALNLVMGLLSVIVHGVRLNLLEFSGQLGMEWSGTAYDPFRVTKK